MSKSIHTLKVVLLVALALCVGGPPSLYALQRTPEITIGPNNQPNSLPPQPQLLTDNGDPDDWASRSEEEEEEEEDAMSGYGVRLQLGPPGGSGITWREYVECFSGRLIRIRLYLNGIL